MRYYELRSIGNSGQVDATSHDQLQPNVEVEETPDQDILDQGSAIKQEFDVLKCRNEEVVQDRIIGLSIIFLISYLWRYTKGNIEPYLKWH